MTLRWTVGNKTDANLVSSNIKDWVTIFWVEWDFGWIAWWDLWTRETVTDTWLDFFYYKKIWDLYLMWGVQFDWMSSTNYPICWWLPITRERIKTILWKTTIVSYIESTVGYSQNSRALWTVANDRYWTQTASGNLIAMVMI